MADIGMTMPGLSPEMLQNGVADIGQAARKAQLSPRDQKAMDKTAKDFEAMVLGQMVGYMFAGVESDPLMGGGFGEEMYRGLLTSEYGKVMAQSGGVGIAAQLKTQLLQMQEAQHHE